MSETKKLLMIDDDPDFVEGIMSILKSAGYEVEARYNPKEGFKELETGKYDLLLLDLVLPGADGLEILREVRGARPTLPVVILTARGEEADRVRGLRMGADDYVVKPFSVTELLARIDAVLRRSPERPSDVKTVGVPGGLADLARWEVRFDDGGRSELTEREVELLRYLACNPGRVISRREILSRVWRVNPRGVDTRTIDMHIARLREKLRDDPCNPRVILTVWGKGYSFGAGEGP